MHDRGMVKTSKSHPAFRLEKALCRTQTKRVVAPAMNPIDEAPKLSPWPFLIGDALLIGCAVLIAQQAPTPLSGAPLFAIVACVALGACLACLPFLLSYTRRQDLALAERQAEIAALARTTADSAEQLSIAAQGLNSLNDTVHRALKHLDQLPQKMQEKINEFKAQLNEVAVTENEVLAQEVNTLRNSEIERLESVFSSIRKTAGELTAVEAATRQHLAEIKQSLGEFTACSERSATEATAAIQRALDQALAALSTRVATFAPIPRPEAPATRPEPPPPSERPPEISQVTSAPPFAAPASSPTIAAAVVAEPVVRKRAPRKAAHNDDQPMLGLDLSESNDYAQSHPDETEPSSALSADGLTRLLVTAYIGIGNKLFIRGSGAGLSWEKGVPLQFVSIGKWRWETADATEPIAVKLYKNDEQEAVSPRELTLEPGHQQEVRASF